MLKPEGTLRQLVEQLHARVQDQEAEFADFQVRAQKYLSALKDEIDRNRKRIELFSSEMEAMEKEGSLDNPLKSTSSRTGVTFSARTNVESDVPESQSERIRELARDILAKSDRPLMQSEIKTRLDELGVEIVAKNVAELVRAALRRHPSEFLHVKGQGWTLVGQDSRFS